jgi:cell pole-organizing protein PopZ
MSRLETSAEPSMEEILASIRKIIAEEPLGSRGAASAKRPPAPEPSAAGSTPKRGFMTRETFLRSPAPSEAQSTGPDRDAVKVDTEPKAETAPVSSPLDPHAGARSADKAEPPRKLDGFHGSAGLNGAGTASELKDEGSAKSEVASAPAASPAPDHVPVEEKAEASEPPSSQESKSIEAQLADLLGDDLQALDSAQQDDPVKAPDSDLALATERDETSHPQMEQEDTGSGGKHLNGAAEADGSDPFAFNLGPSPFFLPPEGSESHAQDAAEKSSPFEALQKNEGKASFDDAHDVAPDLNSYAPAPEPKSPESSAVPPRSERASDAFGVPSVAATLGPHRTLEPLSAAFQSSPFDPPPFERRADRSIEDTAPPAEPDRRSSVRAAFPGERLERILQPALTDQNHQDSAIEDAVADLLRPLLRTWLAENMPKIVERALRREMTERLLPGQKGPFD